MGAGSLGTPREKRNELGRALSGQTFVPPKAKCSEGDLKMSLSFPPPPDLGYGKCPPSGDRIGGWGWVGVGVEPQFMPGQHLSRPGITVHARATPLTPGQHRVQCKPVRPQPSPAGPATEPRPAQTSPAPAVTTPLNLPEPILWTSRNQSPEPPRTNPST